LCGMFEQIAARGAVRREDDAEEGVGGAAGGRTEQAVDQADISSLSALPQRRSRP
jgi:hypothetical protein